MAFLKEMRWRAWAVRLIAVLLVAGLCPLHSRATAPESETTLEYKVKAAFLFNFAKFVEWPQSAFASDRDPIIIGILGDDPFGDTLPQIVKGQSAQGRRIEIRNFKGDEDYGHCHILFLSRSVASRTREILRQLQGRSVLTVSEKEDFVRQGGVIGFALVDKTVRFDINPRVAASVNLKISSKLLAVSRSVAKSL